MAKYQAKNSRVISNAFERFKVQYNQAMIDGLTEIAKKALDYLVTLHDNDDTHRKHINENNTMGYAVGCDGSVIVSSFGFEGGFGNDTDGHAAQMAEALIAGEKKGWSLIVLSDMTNDWYDVAWEEVALQDKTFEFTRDSFDKFFKQIKQ